VVLANDDLNGVGAVNVVDIQKVLDAALDGIAFEGKGI